LHSNVPVAILPGERVNRSRRRVPPRADVAMNDDAIGSLLPEGAITVGAHASDWRAAIQAAGAALTASGATHPGYTDEMIATVEQLGPYIVIAPGIALAHSRPSPQVKRAGLSIVTLAEPVAFGHHANDPVRLVVGLAAPDDESHVAALAGLAEFLSDPERQAALLAARDATSIRAAIEAYEDSSTAGA
jgi:PTS system ascorbate-specific IIA component